MRIAVTGSTGKVGSSIVQHFLRLGYEVVAIDRRLSDGPAEATIVPGLTSHVIDLKNYGQVVEALDRCDAVCHVAGLPWFGDTPAIYASGIENNVVTTSNVFEAAMERGIKRIVYTSSVHAYGVIGSQIGPDTMTSPPDYFPIDEDHPCRPIRPYSVSKLFGEILAQAVCTRVKGVSIASLRLGGVMLPREESRPSMPPPTDSDGHHHLRGALFCVTPVESIGIVAHAAIVSQPAGHQSFNVMSHQSLHDWKPAWLERVYEREIPIRNNLQPHQALISSDKIRLQFGITIDLPQYVMDRRNANAVTT